MQKAKKIITATIGTVLVLCLNIIVTPIQQIGGSGYGDYFPFPTKYFYGSMVLKAPNPDTLWLGVFADIVFWIIIFCLTVK